MASHVVVIDTSARRHVIKTTPGKHLSDVLQEACAKFGLNADQYGLKHNNKPVDLSRTIRLSGFSSGAKLDLVQSSRSPAVVSVALQLPATGSDSSRVTDKFPSNTPIWQILRRFEAGAAGTSADKANHNFTQRATPQMGNGTSGAGRLCYEMPVVTVMGRELASFVDLQKTLGQLGYNSGSCLLRLSYRATEQPLEEAMTEISQYFKAIEEPSSTGAHSTDAGTSESKAEVSEGVHPNAIAEQTISPTDTPMEDVKPPSDIEASTSETIPPPKPGLVIYAPPSTTTPAAASPTNYDESDYIPTVEHATKHQARLIQESRNRRLLSDAEIEAQQQARSAAVSEIKEVVVRIRFPDQSQAQQILGRDAVVSTLYDRCREMMQRPNGEDFSLRITGGKTGTTILKEGGLKLIGDLGWQGRVLVTVVWGDTVSAETRKGPSLKAEYRARAENLKVELPKEAVEEEKTPTKPADQGKEKEKGKGGPEKEAKMMKFLKGLSKK